VAVSGRNLGGHAFEYDPGLKTGHEGVKAYVNGILSDLPSISNVGMLVMVVGRVTRSDAGGIYVDDCSGYNDFPAIGPGAPAGIRATAPTGVVMPEVGSFVAITGISSTYQTTTGLRRLLLVRRQDDIVEM